MNSQHPLLPGCRLSLLLLPSRCRPQGPPPPVNRGGGPRLASAQCAGRRPLAARPPRSGERGRRFPEHRPPRPPPSPAEGLPRGRGSGAGAPRRTDCRAPCPRPPRLQTAYSSSSVLFKTRNVETKEVTAERHSKVNGRANPGPNLRPLPLTAASLSARLCSPGNGRSAAVFARTTGHHCHRACPAAPLPRNSLVPARVSRRGQRTGPLPEGRRAGRTRSCGRPSRGPFPPRSIWPGQ